MKQEDRLVQNQKKGLDLSIEALRQVRKMSQVKKSIFDSLERSDDQELTSQDSDHFRVH